MHRKKQAHRGRGEEDHSYMHTHVQKTLSSHPTFFPSHTIHTFYTQHMSVHIFQSLPACFKRWSAVSAALPLSPSWNHALARHVVVHNTPLVLQRGVLEKVIHQHILHQKKQEKKSKEGQAGNLDHLLTRMWRDQRPKLIRKTLECIHQLIFFSIKVFEIW